MVSQRLTRLLAVVLPTALAAVGCAAEFAEEDEVLGETMQALSAEQLACEGYNTSAANKLASAGLKRQGYRSQGRCYAFVKRHLGAAGRPVPPQLYSTQYGASAYQFANWARNNPRDLWNLGFKEVKLGPGERPPKGSIIVWSRGQCGYSARHGHIEVVVDDGRACSDYCGRIKTGCGAPSVFIPITPGSLGAASSSCTSGGGTPSEAPDDDVDRHDSCVGKSDGWYCSSLVDNSAYLCRNQQIARGHQCPSGTCASSGPNGAAVVRNNVPACN